MPVDKVFTDKASGKDTRWPTLDALLSFARKGDAVVVHSMDRLARNLDDLRRLAQTLTKRAMRIEFIKEHLVFTGEDSPMANLMLSVLGAFAGFERALTRERQRKGLALARQRRVYRARRPALAPEQLADPLSPPMPPQVPGPTTEKPAQALGWEKLPVAMIPR